MTVRSCLAEPPSIWTEASMPPTRIVFEFKCPNGHVTEEKYPPGTSYDAHPHIICPQCKDKLVRAYIIFACPEYMKNRTKDVTSRTT